MVGGKWDSQEQVEGNAANSLALNLCTGPEQDGFVHHYRAVVDSSYTHYWTGKLSQSLNADYGTEEHVGLANGSEGRDNWYGLAHYLKYVFNDYATGVWRAEWFRDEGGSRTGIDGNVYESTWGVNVKPFPNDRWLKTLLLRPEFRWDFACKPAFGDDHYNQLTLAMDLIYEF